MIKIIDSIMYFGLTILILLIGACNQHTSPSTESQFISQEKHKGIHVFGQLDSTNIIPFVDDKYEWISLVPYGGQEDVDSPHVRFSKKDTAYIMRRDSAWSSQIEIAKAAGLKVMLKPHVWIGQPSEGSWRSDIFHKNDDHWNGWKADYRDFILHYARLSEKNEVDLFCVGVEFTRLSLEKPAYWRALISEIRTIYSGKLCYAANWYQEYENIEFWDQLDYIGVQAYFPLVSEQEPSVEQLAKGWEKYMPGLAKISKKYKKAILFTEMGYKSTKDAAIKPWEWMEYNDEQSKNLSLTTQANCYQAFFDTVWKQSWFAGVHIWQARSDWQADERYINLDFTPQGKPAARIIKEGFR